MVGLRHCTQFGWDTKMDNSLYTWTSVSSRTQQGDWIPASQGAYSITLEGHSECQDRAWESDGQKGPSRRWAQATGQPQGCLTHRSDHATPLLQAFGWDPRVPGMKRKLPITSSTAPPSLHLSTPPHNPGLRPGFISYGKPPGHPQLSDTQELSEPLPSLGKGVVMGFSE